MILSPYQQEYIQQSVKYIKVLSVCNDFGINHGKFYRWMHGADSDTADEFIDFCKQVFRIDLLDIDTSKKRKIKTTLK